MPFKNQHPLYSIWSGMRFRCRSTKAFNYSEYGGRGIDVCPEWDSFHTFVTDMGPRPEGHSLDRIDNDKGYSPDNCRWATPSMQTRNQRRTLIATICGVDYIAADLADIAGVMTGTIMARAKAGLSYEEVVSPEAMHHTPAKCRTLDKARDASAQSRRSR